MSNVNPGRPQLTIEELHSLKWLLGGVLTLLAIGTVFYMDIEAWTLMAITGVVAIATIARPTWPARVPRLVHTLSFPAIAAFFSADLWLRGEILPAMVRLDILLLLYRCMTYRQRRDDLQIIVLGLFLVVVAGVLTVSLTFAAHLLVYAGCSLALLLVITLSEGSSTKGPSAQRERSGEGASPPLWAVHANWGQLFRRLRAVADWRVITLGTVLFAGVVVISALLFLAIPRFQIESGMFLDRFISKKAKTGFTDTIRFGDVTEIQQDNSIALSVDVSDQTEIPASPYWRMLVLDQYETGTFRMSGGLRAQEFERQRTQPFVNGYARPRRGEPVMWTFYLESGVSRYLPLIGQFEQIRFRESQTFQFAPKLAIVSLREEPASMMAYRASGFDVSGALPDPSFARRWRERSESSLRRPAMQALVRLGEDDQAAILGVLGEVNGGENWSAGEFARRAGEWLRRNHSYSLTPQIPRGEGDPLVRWLTSRESGHCELFAGSLVVLARMAGFPARVVTGFRGGTWNGYSNNFTVRNADAHAWVEIFDEASGAWLRTDPLAPAAATQAGEARGEAALESRADRSWKARFDSLRVFWYRRIVSFDQQSQAETLKAVKEATQNSGKRVREALIAWMGGVKDWLMAPWDVRRIVAVLGALALPAGATWLWREFGRRWWRGLRRSAGGNRYEDPVRREAGRWLARLDESKHRIHEADRVVEELQRVRFGSRSTWGEPEKIFRRARHAWREGRRRPRVTPS